MSGNLLNQTEAQKYRQSIDDPVVRGICLQGFSEILMSEEQFDGDFDMLFFTKMIHALVRDKDELIEQLLGRGTGDSFLGQD